MNELGISDLKFAESELASFWKGKLGTELPTVELHQLVSRTEGWVAGVQLAVLAYVNGRR